MKSKAFELFWTTKRGQKDDKWETAEKYLNMDKEGKLLREVMESK